MYAGELWSFPQRLRNVTHSRNRIHSIWVKYLLFEVAYALRFGAVGLQTAR
jgi:hypothetical protein